MSQFSETASNHALLLPLRAPRKLTFRMPVYPSLPEHCDHTLLAPASLTSVIALLMVSPPLFSTDPWMVPCFPTSSAT